MDISKISLSHQTIAKRIEEIGKRVGRSLERKAVDFKFCALAMTDELGSPCLPGVSMMNIMPLKKWLL